MNMNRIPRFQEPEPSTENNPYMPCKYLPSEPCIWVEGPSVGCDSCMVARGVGVIDVCGYIYASDPVKLRYELSCLSELYYADEIDSQIALDQGITLNWYADFTQTYGVLESWLRQTKSLERIDKKYLLCLDMVLANFLLIGDSNQQLLHPKKKESSIRRNPEGIGYRLVQNVLEFLVERKLVWEMPGIADPNEKLCTWYIPTQRLLNGLNKNEVKVGLNPNALLVDYKERDTEKKDWIPVALPPEYLEEATQMNLPARAHATSWGDHTATLRGRRIVPFLWRVFNGSLDMGGRFYSGYQNMPKEDRKQILIDGVETVEPDFSAFHPSILYADNDIQIEGDPYVIELYDRETIKSVFLMMLNHDNRSHFIGQITKSGNPNTKREWAEHQQRLEYSKSRGLGPQKLPEKLKGFIVDVPDNQDGLELLTAIEQAHPRIKDCFFSGGLGMQLQFKDSEIMAAILTELSSREIPVLPVHDSLRCQVSDHDVVVSVMKQKYLEITGFECEVK